MAKKVKAVASQEISSKALQAKLDNVKCLYRSNKAKEAIAYIYILYSKLAEFKWGLAKKATQSIRDYAIQLVKQKGQQPKNIYPFIQQVESIIYGGRQPSEESYTKTIQMFAVLYKELTGSELPSF
jgi:hypothetical protein